MKDILDLLAQLGELRRHIQFQMLALPERFQRAAPQTLLKLRCWCRRKLSRPYAVYWIILNRRRIREYRWQKEKPTFPFRRPVIRTRENLDDAIFFARASKVRRVVYQFHRQVKALNASHAEISRGLDTLRKRLGRFPDLPVDQHMPSLAGRLRGFEHGIDDARIALQRLDLDMSILPGLPFRLVYEQDFEHPYGRVRWRRVADGRPIPPLTDKLKRILKVPSEVRPLLTPHELARRRAMARMKSLSMLRRGILVFLPPLLRRTRERLGAFGIDLPQEAA